MGMQRIEEGMPMCHLRNIFALPAACNAEWMTETLRLMVGVPVVRLNSSQILRAVVRSAVSWGSVAM